MKNLTFFVILGSLVFMSVVAAELQVGFDDDDSDPKVVLDVPVTLNTTMNNVNRSDFWDNLDNPADFLLSMFDWLDWIDRDIDLNGNDIVDTNDVYVGNDLHVTDDSDFGGDITVVGTIYGDVNGTVTGNLTGSYGAVNLTGSYGYSLQDAYDDQELWYNIKNIILTNSTRFNAINKSFSIYVHNESAVFRIASCGIVEDTYGCESAFEIRGGTDEETGWPLAKVYSKHWIPFADGLYDLGESTARWKDLYLSGTIKGSGSPEALILNASGEIIGTLFKLATNSTNTPNMTLYSETGNISAAGQICDMNGCIGDAIGGAYGVSGLWLNDTTTTYINSSHPQNIRINNLTINNSIIDADTGQYIVFDENGAMVG